MRVTIGQAVSAPLAILDMKNRLAAIVRGLLAVPVRWGSMHQPRLLSRVLPVPTTHFKTLPVKAFVKHVAIIALAIQEAQRLRIVCVCRGTTSATIANNASPV